jgi:flagellar hook-basal body complex protein FliE
MIGSIGSSGYSNLLGRGQDIVARKASSTAESIEGISKSISIPSTQTSGETGGASFAKVLEQAVQEVDGKMKAADSDQNKLLSGETDNLHQAMISIQESSVAFSLMVEVRNKLMDSYQELMRMQV